MCYVCMCTAIQKCISEFRGNTDTMHVILKSVCMCVCMCVLVCLPVGVRVCMVSMRLCWPVHMCVKACVHIFGGGMCLCMYVCQLVCGVV